jgi:hypothetical protein
MKITEIAFTGYPVTEIDRARAFYEGIPACRMTIISDPDGNSITIHQRRLG